MKRICVFIGFITLLAACSKKSNNVQPQDPNIVKINGTAYPTVTIGNLVWTTTNYSGPGGYHSADHNQYGDYYTLNQAMLIDLPAGWRVPIMQDYTALLTNFGNGRNAEGFAQLDGSEVGNLLSTSAAWPQAPGGRSGFNAQPNGFFQVDSPNPAYHSDGQEAYFMTANMLGFDNRFGVRVTISGAGVGAAVFEDVHTNAYSLRFVKDK